MKIFFPMLLLIFLLVAVAAGQYEYSRSEIESRKREATDAKAALDQLRKDFNATAAQVADANNRWNQVTAQFQKAQAEAIALRTQNESLTVRLSTATKELQTLQASLAANNHAHKLATSTPRRFEGCDLFIPADSDIQDEVPGYFSTEATAATDKVISLIYLEPALVNRTEAVLRNADISDDIRRKQMQAALNSFTGMRINGAVTIAQIIESSSAKCRSDASPRNLEKYLVLARCNWLTSPSISDRDRAAIAQINRQCDDKVNAFRKEILGTTYTTKTVRNSKPYTNGTRGTHTDYSEPPEVTAKVKRLQDSIEQVEASRQQSIKSIRDGAGAGRPTPILYLSTSDTAVCGWRPGEVHTITGTVSYASAFLYPHAAVPGEGLPPENNSGAYIGSELVVHLNSPATANPTQP